MIVQANKMRLYYEKTGQGKPLILLHGNGEDHHIFDEIIPALSKEFTVYAVDSRGHGQSQPTEDFDYRKMAADLEEFIVTLQIEKPLFYGFSDGGIIGILLAATWPDLLSRLIISGANINPQGLHAVIRLGFKLIYLLKKDQRVKMVLEQPNISPGELRKIKIPTFVVAGSHDMITAAHTRMIAKHISGSTLKILKGEGHGSYVVHSQKLLPILRLCCGESGKEGGNCEGRT